VADEIRHFTDLRVWREAHSLFLNLLGDASNWPAARAAQIVLEQLVRSTASIGANIAEGFNRSRNRFANSLDIALGEASETENWLYKARDAGYLAPDVARARLKTIIDIEKMLSSLQRKIRKSPDRAGEETLGYEVWHPDLAVCEQPPAPSSSNEQRATSNDPPHQE
jgi:four helix bundle protein